ncbi:MAG: SET domain-containing protein-lysine N-methyltransferase [Candidatus Omnitrophica bacterium]|nr:SET domain-containing protein-lysine N-methyltransferase [Candidatus Omnitrophota bacterium]
MPRKTTSPYVVVRDSRIHSTGVFAKKFIPEGTRIIEYVGERITKAESDRRADIPLNRHKKDAAHGAVYIFQLNKRYDVDGAVSYNTARFLNHSCDPDCETDIIRGHIWIIALRDIEKGEELTYSYGYDFEDYQEHKCCCGSKRCVGYILAEEHWPKLKRALARKKKTRKKIVSKESRKEPIRHATHHD